MQEKNAHRAQDLLHTTLHTSMHTSHLHAHLSPPPLPQEKNAHMAQELDAQRAQRMLEDLEKAMRAHPKRETRAGLDTELCPRSPAPQAITGWCRAIKRTQDVIRDVSDRARDAQHQVSSDGVGMVGALEPVGEYSRGVQLPLACLQ